MQAFCKILQNRHPQIQRENNAPCQKGLTTFQRMWYSLSNTSSGGSLRIGEAQYEAAGDHDVHDDAHVHVPHEHALLCQSSLRFSINADRLSNQDFRYHGGQ